MKAMNQLSHLFVYLTKQEYINVDSMTGYQAEFRLVKDNSPLLMTRGDVKFCSDGIWSFSSYSPEDLKQEFRAFDVHSEPVRTFFNNLADVLEQYGTAGNEFITIQQNDFFQALDKI